MADIGGDRIFQTGPGAIGKVVFGSTPKPEPRTRQTVLLLMSNPTGLQPLRLDEEHRAIDLAIANARHRDRIDLRTGLAPRYHDLQDLLLRYRPAVVHFAGHSSANGVALVDESGWARPVPPAALEELFAVIGPTVRCVVLNACLTRSQASAIGEHVPCVVGMSQAVLDTVAIEFAAGFYRALADGRSVADAFLLGRNRLALAGMDATDPVLIGDPEAANRVFITR